MQKQDFLIFFSNIFFLEVGFEQVKLDLGYFALKAVKRKHTKGRVTNDPHFASSPAHFALLLLLSRYVKLQLHHNNAAVQSLFCSILLY